MAKKEKFDLHERRKKPYIAYQSYLGVVHIMSAEDEEHFLAGHDTEDFERFEIWTRCATVNATLMTVHEG